MVRSVRLALASALVLALAGCASTATAPDPLESPAVLEGEWSATGPGGEEAVLELGPDGSMSSTGMPVQVLLGVFGDHSLEPIDWSQTVDRSGRWWVHEKGPRRYITLSYAPPIGEYTGAILNLEAEGSNWTVYYPIVSEDTGERLEFLRQSGDPSGS